MGQSGSINIGGKWIESVSPEMRQVFKENGYLDPRNNRIVAATGNVRMDVDHILPVKEIIEMPGFEKLSREQMTNILRDKLGFGNLQPLPQSLNASKGARLGDKWGSYKNTEINAEYSKNLKSFQINIYNQQNKAMN